MKKSEFDSKYRLIHVAARRARQIQSGAPTLVETKSQKASRIAQDEITAGKVDYVIEEKKKKESVVAAEEHFDGGSH